MGWIWKSRARSQEQSRWFVTRLELKLSAVRFLYSISSKWGIYTSSDRLDLSVNIAFNILELPLKRYSFWHYIQGGYFKCAMWEHNSSHVEYFYLNIKYFNSIGVTLAYIQSYWLNTIIEFLKYGWERAHFFHSEHSAMNTQTVRRKH